MPCRDFFSFCTTLKPVELKALGELSRVRHLQKGERVYAAGDPADGIYSVNRGVIELARFNHDEPESQSFLSRGDLFGTVEAFAQVPRIHSATAQELVSLQFFDRANFDALCKRIPSFFLFLCEQMALHVQQVPGGAVPATNSQQLRGDLANFDLITIHQTIISSGQTGELCLLNENGERIATFAFRDGAPCSGQFQHLTGEEAFWQLFQCDSIPGTFSFTTGAKPITECIQSAEINASPQDLLLSALQSRDELHALRKILPETRTPLERSGDFFAWPSDADENLLAVGERIWRLMDRRRMTIDQLFRLNSVCELKINLVVSEMLRAGLIVAREDAAFLRKAS